MIDIHAHILPGIDDGPKTIREAIHMLRIASEKGVHTIAATAHCNIDDLYGNFYHEKYYSIFKELEAEIASEKIPVKIVAGTEVYASEELPALLKMGKIISLNKSRYILLEFGNHKDLALISFVISELISLGYIPIIAHPERYPYVQKEPHLAGLWLKQGCLLQLNRESILGTFGKLAKNTAIYLLKRNMASFIASDAHDPFMRTTDLSAAYNFISDYFSENMAYLLMEENPGKVMCNHDFYGSKAYAGLNPGLSL